MKVYYDYQILYSQKYGGISRYYYELIRTIEKLGIANTDISCLFSTNHYFDGYNGIKEGNAFLDIKSSLFRRPLRLCGHIINKLVTKRKAKDADIIHLTFYNPYALTISGAKKVVTVYDMIDEIKRNDGKSDGVIANKKECIFKADHIIAISENTKKDILRLYPEIDSSKISVIHIGTYMSGDCHNEVVLPDRYILFVGQRGGYKNFNTFAKAVVPLLTKYKDLSLLCIGGDEFSQDELNMFEAVENRVKHMNVDDASLAMAYKNAECFVFPSVYEGFGIPTLEAFSCGCPAIISDTSSMPEVGGDAVLYFDPLNVEEMRNQIERVLVDNTLRVEMGEKGKERLSLFAWDLIAKQTVECYKRVIENG